LNTPDPFLDAEELRRSTFVRHVEVHDSLASTNNYAVELAREETIELPALVVARLQTGGRGRGQKAWWSSDGALTFSLILDQASTGISVASWPRLSLATAVAVCDALLGQLSSNSRLAIKWPNDVLLDGGKICGILIESPGGRAPAKDRVIVGIGINVNNSWRSAPHQAGHHGTALCDITGLQHDLTGVLASVLAAFATRVSELLRQDGEVFRAWKRLDFLAGRRVILERDGQKLEGTCTQIADDGALLMSTAIGQQRVYSGSVQVLE
jgi:BirA family biotin operon repressor/biotin-[acetyl-CoA-carboxylase] ligase